MFWARRKSLIHNHIHHHPQPHRTQLLTFPHHMKKMSIFIYIILFFGQCGFVHDRGYTISSMSANWYHQFFFMAIIKCLHRTQHPGIFFTTAHAHVFNTYMVNIFFVSKMGVCLIHVGTHNTFTIRIVILFFVGDFFRLYVNGHEMIIYI